MTSRVLGQVLEAVRDFNLSVESGVQRVRKDDAFAAEIRGRWEEARAAAGETTTPTGLKLPRLALPQTDEPGEMARYLLGEGLPGEFPFVSAIYPRMYLAADGDEAAEPEEPTRLFAGLGLARDTNERFRFLTRHQKSWRLSTAFDGPTLYGLDSDHPDVLGKIGEGGVAIDTVEDMEQLYEGFPLDDPGFSVSMTINGPAPAILAMYVAAAQRACGADRIDRLRGTVQADVLKEVQAQNELLFPVESSLRFLTDMVAFVTERMPRFYPISVSGYHMTEAGATPVQQAAYTLSNGFAYVERFRERGLDLERFAPRLSFFLDCGLDVEYLVLARVCRKLWAIGMRDVFGARERSQKFKLHIQTSGRSLVASEYKNNLTRTAIELIQANLNATNSCHSNSADEPFTTPSEEYARLAAHAQAIVLEESGIFKHMMNTLPGSPGMKILEQRVEEAILEEFRRIDELGGVLVAMEHRYQRSRIQAAAHRYERAVADGSRPIVGVNRYRVEEEEMPAVPLVRIPRARKEEQVARVRAFKERHAGESGPALDRLAKVVEEGGNVFEELVSTVEACTLGQITKRFEAVCGRYRPSL